MSLDNRSEMSQVFESLNEIAYSTLKAEILALRYPPGARLSERRIASAHEMSLNPVRSALARLVNDGLLTVRPRSGYVVTPISPRSARELFEVWSLTAGSLAILAIGKSTPESRVEMVRYAERLGEFGHDEVDKATIHAFEMFELFAAIADNDRITASIRQVRGELARFVLMVEQVHPLRPAIVENAHGLVECIHRLDGSGARTLLEAFINKVGRYAVAVVADLAADDNVEL